MLITLFVKIIILLANLNSIHVFCYMKATKLTTAIQRLGIESTMVSSTYAKNNTLVVFCKQDLFPVIIAIATKLGMPHERFNNGINITMF